MTNTARIWNQQQNAFFAALMDDKAGNLVVRARAGCTKTTSSVEGINRVSVAAPNKKILAVAFNKKIANELTQRITAPNAEAKTLHGLGFAYIRRQWSSVKVDAYVDFDRAVDACGKNAPDDMIKLVIKLASLLKGIAPLTTDVEVAMEIAESFDVVPDESWEEEGWTVDSVAACAITARDAAKVRDDNGRISFDDMIFIPVACGFARPWYDMVLVDEAQDMNAAQLLLARAACKAAGRIVVVGDDCQAIYGFRGADADSIDRLKSELGATELGLKTTYRCAQAIVLAAQKYVPDFICGEGAQAGKVDEMIAGSEAFFKAAKPGDFVLSRKNAPLMGICLGLLRRGVKARIEGRDVGAGLKAIVKSIKAKSIPHFIERVGTWAGKQIARAKKLHSESVRSNKISNIEDQRDMLIALVEGCASVDEATTRIDRLFSDTPADERAAASMEPAVVCSSVHRSKGLEADHVFVLKSTIKDTTREERNIAYVAVTRAKNHLTWLTAE